jgi:hypothetical protein
LGEKIGVGAFTLTFSRKIRGRVRSPAKSLSRVLHDLIQPETIDIRFHLDPNRQVVGHLEGELGTAVVVVGKRASMLASIPICSPQSAALPRVLLRTVVANAQ